ncbi:MAG: Ig-like domain-containing protein [Chitinophagaceae bacterium]|nr:Ig-like domain-containing protein [Chitinophagaceae bacterium]
MKRLYLFFMVCLLLALPISHFAQISLSGGTYQQDFNTLALTGTSGTLPAGWLFFETGTNANALYNTGTGSGNGGDTYSFGIAGSSERAFGGLQSGNLIPMIGAFFINNTGSVLSSITISYTGEVWRLGTADRGPDILNFQISTDASALNTGVWTDVDALDFSSPVTTAPVGLRDGNEAANRTTISFTITGLAIANGAGFYIRWTDFNPSGADDGLGVDDFSITTGGVDNIPPVASTVSPANNAVDVLPGTIPAITFNESIMANTGNITIHNVTNGTNQIIAVSSPAIKVAGTVVTIDINLLPLRSYYIEIDAGAFKDATGNLFAGLTGTSAWAFTTGPQQLAFDFNSCSGTGLSGGFRQYSVIGPITWACTTFGQTGNGIQINGFSGTAQENQDWLISPVFDLSTFAYPLLTFATRTRFAGPSLKLMVSTNYDGLGDPNGFVWTEIQGRFPDPDSDVWMTSRDINLSAFKNQKVYIAFVYTSSPASGAARWTVDDFVVINSPVVPRPAIIFKPAELDFDYTQSGASSARLPFTINAYNLQGNLTIRAPLGFSVSTDSIQFSSSITITQTAAESVNHKLYARFIPYLPNREFSGNIRVTSTNLDTLAVKLSGSSLRALKVVNWNIEWFGSTEFGPTNEPLQQQNVKTILQKLDADLFALEEVVDTLKLKEMVDQMPGYAYTISDFSSRADDLNDPDYPSAQKLAFVYKTSVVKKLYTYGVLRFGGSADAYNDWASGRFPYLMKAEVNLQGVTATVNFVVIHSKANTGTVAERVESWERRKGGIDELKDSLDVYYPYSNLILLGDFNDDLDSTIAPNIPGNISSYINLINDSVDYKLLTLPLSRAGLKSTVSFDNVIDHQVASNEMGVAYVPGSAKILTYVSTMVSGYATTTTDHYPVVARYDMRFFTDPIDVQYFLAAPWGRTVEFYWYTNHEINSDRFVVERSRNNKDYEPIDSVKGKGDSRQWSIYNLKLDDPWPGKSYYRLRIVSLNGSVLYSNIVTLNRRLQSYFLYVNGGDPFMAKIEYTLSETKRGTLQLMDVTGKMYFERPMTFLKGKNFQNIPTNNLPAGTYIVRIVHADRVESKKVVIRK